MFHVKLKRRSMVLILYKMLYMCVCVCSISLMHQLKPVFPSLFSFWMKFRNSFFPLMCFLLNPLLFLCYCQFLPLCLSIFFFFFLYLGSPIWRRRPWQPTPVLLPGKSNGRKRLVGCSPWVCDKSDTTEAT